MSPAEPPPESESRPSRRAVLAALGTASATALAGCNALGEETTPVYDGDWTQFGNGATNANRVSGGMPEPTARTRLTAAGWVFTPPVVHGETVYLAANGGVAAFGVDGTERWSQLFYESEALPEDFEVSGAPAVDPERGRLYVPARRRPTTDGSATFAASLAVFSLGGDLLRTIRVDGERTYGVTLLDGDAYVRSSTACVRLAPDGTERWRRPLDPLGNEEYNLGESTATQITPAITDDAVYVPDRSAVVSLDRETGDERWRVPVDTPYGASVVDDDGIVQTGWQETVAVDHTGEVRWRREDLRSVAAAALADGDCYVVAPYELHELDAATGETNWKARLTTDSIAAAPVVTDDSVLVAEGSLLAYRREVSGVLAPDRKRWSAASGQASQYCTPVVAAGTVFVVSSRGLFALGTEPTP